ncbi:MAG: RpnC/YadD family protein [Isosphaeraceae bacterium]
MANEVDTILRNMTEARPAEWNAFAGGGATEPNRVRVIDSNISTALFEADRVLLVEDPAPWIHNIEIQATRDKLLDERLHVYSALLRYRHRMPVRTTVVLLKKDADRRGLSGELEQRHSDGEIYDQFRYNVIRIWEQPVERILSAGLTILPLAPIARVKRDRVPRVLVAVAERLRREATPEQVSDLWGSTAALIGLRYADPEIEEILRGVSAMVLGIRGIEESSVYQAILKKGIAEGEARGEARGRAEQARETLIDLGCKKLGPLRKKAKAKIAALEDLDRLKSLTRRISDVASWDELLSSAD